MASELMEAIASLGRSVDARAARGKSWETMRERLAAGPVTMRPLEFQAAVTIGTARREQDEWVCLGCRRRWGVDEDRPPCERNCR